MDNENKGQDKKDQGRGTDEARNEMSSGDMSEDE